MRALATAVAFATFAVAGCSGSSPRHTLPETTPLATTTTTNSPSVQPTVTAASALRGHLHRAWSTGLDAAMYARPVVAGDLVLAATENNTVYAVDLTTGRVRWRHHLAPPARLADLPCGNIDPSGITGTPAYDATTHLVYVATEDHDARHTLFALEVSDGRVRWQRSLDVAPERDRHAEQQRGALLVSGGRVYVPVGGRFGDCGNYVGYLVAVDVHGTGPTLRYEVPTAREAGIWAAAGPVVGPGGDIYVASGNGAEVDGRYDGSDSVIRLSPMLQRKAIFAPSSWRQDNADDLDLGSMSPVPVAGRILIAGKRGEVYLLSETLGGIGGQLTTLDGCAGYGGAAVSGTTVLMPCDAGVRALRVSGSHLLWQWRDSNLHGSPAIVGDAVYGFDDGNLVDVGLADGHERGRVHVGEVTRFAAPVPAGGFVFVGTTGQLVAVTGTG